MISFKFISNFVLALFWQMNYTQNTSEGGRENGHNWTKVYKSQRQPAGLFNQRSTRPHISSGFFPRYLCHSRLNE